MDKDAFRRFLAVAMGAVIINVLTIVAMFFFAANTDVPLSAATITTTQKNIVTYIVVIKLPQF